MFWRMTTGRIGMTTAPLLSSLISYSAYFSPTPSPSPRRFLSLPSFYRSLFPSSVPLSIPTLPSILPVSQAHTPSFVMCLCLTMSLLTEYFVLEHPYGLHVLYWNIPIDGVFCTGTSLLTIHCVLEHPYWLHILYWNIPTDWMFCTGIFLLTEYF